MTRSQSAGSESTNGPTLSQPALFTSTSIRPNWRRTSATIAATSSREVTSQAIPTPPTACAVSLAVASLMSVTATVAPSAASFSAMPRPMPCPAPVTIAIFPCSFPIFFLSVCSGGELATELLPRDDQLHDLGGAVADLQAEHVAHPLLDRAVRAVAELAVQQ